VWADAIKSDGTLTVSPGTTFQDYVQLTNSYLHINRATDAAAAEIYLSCDDGQAAYINYRTGALMRWRSGKDSDAEGGANEGSNFYIARYNDAGAYIDTPFQIYRETGDLYISRDTFPTADSSLDLGKTGAVYAEVWTDAIKSDNVITITATTSLNTATDIFPTGDNTLDLGKTGGQWAEVWTQYLKADGDIQVSQDFKPDTDSTLTLGKTAKVWSAVWTDLITSDNAVVVNGVGSLTFNVGGTTEASISATGLDIVDVLTVDHIDDSGAGEIEIQTILDCDQHANGRLVVPVGADMYATR
jgi:hypothetical protein